MGLPSGGAPPNPSQGRHFHFAQGHVLRSRGHFHRLLGFGRSSIGGVDGDCVSPRCGRPMALALWTAN